MRQGNNADDTTAHRSRGLGTIVAIAAIIALGETDNALATNTAAAAQRIGNNSARLAATIVEIHSMTNKVLIGLSCFAMLGVSVSAWFGRFPWQWF